MHVSSGEALSWHSRTHEASDVSSDSQNHMKDHFHLDIKLSHACRAEMKFMFGQNVCFVNEVFPEQPSPYKARAMLWIHGRPGHFKFMRGIATIFHLDVNLKICQMGVLCDEVFSG